MITELTLTRIDGSESRTLTGLEANGVHAIIKGMVQTHITDPATGKVLDVRTVVAVIDPDDITNVWAVCAPERWESIKNEMQVLVPRGWGWHTS